MKREFSGYLEKWLLGRGRLPLVVRGARQVGKTWLVRDLATGKGMKLLEINFERNPEAVRYFRATDPQQIFDDLCLAQNREAKMKNTILFLDEIQAAPEVFSRLRWFAEEMPELAIVAAGSLLEFALEDLSHSMPVGRIRYAFVEPLSFAEYLRAHGEEVLLSRLEQWEVGEPLSEVVHEKAGEWFYRYTMVGGMPAVVSLDAGGGTAHECRSLQRDLIQTYRDDFGKYSMRLDNRMLDRVLLTVLSALGEKFVYSHVGDEVKYHQVKTALEGLALARLCDLIPHTAANGIPLAAQANERMRKVALLDVGLAHGMWNTPAGTRFPSYADLAPQIRGGVTEQVVAQQLRIACGAPDMMGQLYHWRREGGRAGEIDFLVEVMNYIIPIEVKSGAAGGMKSLHQFMFDKQLGVAVRIDSNPPSLQHVEVKTTQGDAVEYKLLNLPHYLTWRLPELVGSVLGSDSISG